jgi:3-oxoacyl-[acyl-carrier protein] reductase
MAAEPMGRFDGRVAMVTGAGSPIGIGFATASLLANEGAHVALASTTGRIHDRVAELRVAGATASGHVGDLMAGGTAERLVRAAVEEHGRLDILINNAGMVAVGAAEESSQVADLEQAEWERGIARNLGTAFAMTRAALPALIASGRGRIVFVSSVTGPLVGNPGSAVYGAAKAGIVGLMHSLAIELGPRGVTVNAVLPGWIASGSQLPEEAIGGQNTPLGRSGTPREVAEAIAFLASDGASYITGQGLIVDGGNTIQEFKGPSEAWY